MAETLSLDRVKLDFSGKLSDDDPSAPASAALALAKSFVLAIGTGADKVSKCYFKRLTVAAGGTLDIDLAGTLTSRLGGALVYGKVRLLILYLRPAANAGPLLVGGHPTAAFGDWIVATPDLATAQPKVRARNGASGGLFMVTGTDLAAFAVTAGTADTLRLGNEGTAPADVDAVILGE